MEFLKQLSSRAKSCPHGVDGDISLSYQNLFGKKYVKGYFQILSPSFIKLIVSNPFGQPVLAIASDQSRFQLINTLERKYIVGSVYSYGLLNNIPLALLRGDWNEWVRGTISVDPSTITDIREDREHRGIWVTEQRKTDARRQKTHLLIELQDGNLLSRIDESDTGEVFVKIIYEDWLQVGNCIQPHLIRVSGLNYRTELVIKLSDVLIDEDLREDDFQFTAPANYPKQIFP